MALHPGRARPHRRRGDLLALAAGAVAAVLLRAGVDYRRAVVVHRLSTIRDTALIVVIDDGGVRESGAHSELVARRGLYARLIERQQDSVRAAE